MLGAESQELRRVSCWGVDPCIRKSFTVDDCWALRRGEAHEVLHTGELVCAHFDTPPANGYLCLPLVVRGETLGLLNLEYPPQASVELLLELKDTLHSVAETIKLALSNLRLRIALQEQATHDSLTGLYNRRYLDETLRRELHRLERHGGSLTVAMLDIDHFKRFNDNMGHEAGDLVLREIGKLLRENLRKSDVGCRYGGEELLLIFLDSSVDDARGRLADICEQIRSMQIPYRGGQLPQVTVSVGISATTLGHEEAVTLLRAADAALYQAKKSGRDRIVVEGDPLAAT
jgi:diguanylate cyclase (GGDEF)-like protein